MPLPIRFPSEGSTAQLTLIDTLATWVVSFLMLATVGASGKASPANGALKAAGGASVDCARFQYRGGLGIVSVGVRG